LNFNLKNSLWAIAFFLVALTWYFGLKIDLTGDSGLYAAISRQMVESGNWLDLEINDRPYDQKPHMFFWLAGLGIELFGNTNFAFKLLLFLFGVMGIYFTYRLARLLFSETAGRLAALFAGTSQMFFLYFLDIHTDTVLQSAVILSLWQLAEYLEHKKPVNFVFAFTGIGLAMLTKGPVGAVLPFFFVLFYLLLKKDYRQLVHPKWLAGIVWVLLIISPTLYHLWKSFGAEGLRFYFIDNNIGRVSGEVAGSSTELFFYTYNLLWAFLPWTVPVIAGLASEIKTWFTDRNRNKYNAALLGSVVVLFGVYSIARGKAPNYLMMLMPPLAVVAAGRIREFVHWSAKLKKGVIYFHNFLLAILVLLLFASWYFVIEEKGTGLLILLAVTVVILSLFFFRNEHENIKRTLFISLLITAAFNLFQNAMVIPELFRYQGARQAIQHFEKDEAGEKQLFSWDLEEYELFFMAEDSVRNIADWEQMHEAMKKPGTWLYTNEGKHDEIVKMGFNIDTVYRIEQRGMNSAGEGGACNVCISIGVSNCAAGEWWALLPRAAALG
jgi:4-amino-4-deoxy-L-arabinose transferase-like glycosyltransferase